MSYDDTDGPLLGKVYGLEFLLKGYSLIYAELRDIYVSSGRQSKTASSYLAPDSWTQWVAKRHIHVDIPSYDKVGIFSEE